MCYLIAKDSEGHGCYALKTKHGKHLAAPYHFVDTEQEFMSLVKAMRP